MKRKKNNTIFVRAAENFHCSQTIWKWLRTGVIMKLFGRFWWNFHSKSELLNSKFLNMLESEKSMLSQKSFPLPLKAWYNHVKFSVNYNKSLIVWAIYHNNDLILNLLDEIHRYFYIILFQLSAFPQCCSLFSSCFGDFSIHVF